MTRLLILLVLLAAPAWAQDYPRELEPLVPPERVLSALGYMVLPEEPPTAADTPATVDILYVYTGSVAATTCQATVDRFNLINRNSLIGHVTVRMAGCRHLSQASSGSLSTDLGRLWSTNDGWYDEAHAWRAEVGADLIQMLIPSDNAGGAGLGYLTSTASSAYSVVVASQAVGNMSGPHESGHNFGCAHNRANASTAPVYPYSYGWRAGTWRSVMSYAPGTRIPYWSSPLVLCQGVPCGTVNDDNARTIAQRASIVANFRTRPRKPARPLGARVETL